MAGKQNRQFGGIDKTLAKTTYIELGRGRHLVQMPILYEDRSALAIDKPAGWMLVPVSWQQTSRNLQAAIESSIRAGDFWARCRQLKYLRHVHRLDAETSGILFMAKHPGAMEAYTRLFEERRMEKTYWAVVRGASKADTWTCLQKIGPDPSQAGRMRVDEKNGREAETHFRVLHQTGGRMLLEARPLTGRTHQIRLHLAASGYPVLGDTFYGGPSTGASQEFPVALRAMRLAYVDPFQRRRVIIEARGDGFLRVFGMPAEHPPQVPLPVPPSA